MATITPEGEAVRLGILNPLYWLSRLLDRLYDRYTTIPKGFYGDDDQ